MAAAEDAPPGHLVFCLQCAGGGGDVAFGVNLCTALLAAPALLSVPLTVLVGSTKGGADGIAETLQAALPACAQCTVLAVAPGPVQVEVSHPRVAVLSGPVSAEIASRLHLHHAGSAVVPAANALVREFGHAGFCTPSSALDDMAAGLGSSALGVFRLALPPPAAAPPHAVVHLRAAKHMTGAARAVASVAALRGEREVLAVAPEGPAFLRRWARGMAAAGWEAGPAPDSAQAAASAAAGSSLGGQDVTAVGHFTAGPAGVTLGAVASSWAQPTFRALLAGSVVAVVTGDATFNEALVAGVPFWYAAAPHKRGVRQALLWRLRQCEAGGEGAGLRASAAAVLAWWAWVEVGVEGKMDVLALGMPVGPATAPEAGATLQAVDDWGAVEAALDAVVAATAATSRAAALDAAFNAVCAALMERCGGLVPRLLQRLGLGGHGGSPKNAPVPDAA